MSSPSSTLTPFRYVDFYGMLSYKDFLLAEAAGTLADYVISTRSDEGQAAA